MLFNSYLFIFVFLPTVLAGFYLARGRTAVQVVWLAAASIFFYGYWSRKAVPILLASIAFNYLAGRLILAFRGGREAKLVLVAALVGDLALLAYYKYAGFFVENLCAAVGICPVLAIVLPIGISFFTFTQIAYLVDAYQGKVADTSLARYVLFVVYFPHLIAGPILHHAEMMSQFRALRRDSVTAEHFSVGLTVFTIGLFKKVVLADSVAVLVPPVFDAEVPSYSSGDAWVAALAYTFQLYFDFSGYSDMALGSPISSASSSRSISTRLIRRPASPSSGSGGTSAFLRFCGTTSTSR